MTKGIIRGQKSSFGKKYQHAHTHAVALATGTSTGDAARALGERTRRSSVHLIVLEFYRQHGHKVQMRAVASSEARCVVAGRPRRCRLRRQCKHARRIRASDQETVHRHGRVHADAEGGCCKAPAAQVGALWRLMAVCLRSPPFFRGFTDQLRCQGHTTVPGRRHRPARVVGLCVPHAGVYGGVGLHGRRGLAH